MDAAQTLTDMARTILDHAFHMTIVDFFSDRVEDEYGETTPIESVPSQFLDDAALSIRGAVMINLFLTEKRCFYGYLSQHIQHASACQPSLVAI